MSDKLENSKNKTDADSLIQSDKTFDIIEIKNHLEAGPKIQLSDDDIIKLYKNEKVRDTEKVKREKNIQKKFNSYFKMAESLLSSKWRDCDCNSNNQTRGCAAVKELFIWSLQETTEDSMKLAVFLWSHSFDKISCACIGWAVKTEMMKTTNELEQKWSKLEQDAKVFQELAISTLKSCHEENEILTRSLLRKRCPWWNDLSILQIVVGTENKEFLAQPACETHMTKIWLRGRPEDEKRGHEKIRCQTLVDAPFKGCSCWDNLSTRAPFSCFSWPVVRYSISLILHLVFLGVYSFVLLFSFNRKLTRTFYVLIVWVVDIAASEFRQALNPNPNSNAQYLEVKKHCKSYWQQKWNWLDVLTIVLFAVGMLVCVEDETPHIIGKTVLSIDLFFFCIRLLQLLMVFKELGLLLVMVRKMIRDTVNFMFILMIFVIAFAVSSEAILYSKRELGYRHIFLILRKAYWQVFGELFLDEISFIDKGNDTASLICTDPPCPSTYGQYFVPIMLGFYVMVTNVLLLNLLIARFNKTFEAVHDQAVAYQSWHRALIIIEYHNHAHLPPPFNILRLVFWPIHCIICRESKIGNETSKEQITKNMKNLEEKHARNALEETKQRLLKQVANSDDNQKSMVDNQAIVEMKEQLEKLSEVIKQLQDILQKR